MSDRPSRQDHIAHAERIGEEFPLRHIDNEVGIAAGVEHDFDEIALILDGASSPGRIRSMSSRRTATAIESPVLRLMPGVSGTWMPEPAGAAMTAWRPLTDWMRPESTFWPPRNSATYRSLGLS